ncbi:hypothetical protein LTR94_036414, partial [Friedmanniomyces endolithicus]
QDHPLPDLSRDPPGPGRRGRDSRTPARLRARSRPHRHRRPPGHRHAAHLRGVEAAVHDQLSHQIPGIRLGPFPDPGAGRLRLYEVVPQAVGPADGRHADPARRT